MCAFRVTNLGNATDYKILIEVSSLQKPKSLYSFVYNIQLVREMSVIDKIYEKKKRTERELHAKFYVEGVNISVQNVTPEFLRKLADMIEKKNIRVGLDVKLDVNVVDDGNYEKIDDNLLEVIKFIESEGKVSYVTPHLVTFNDDGEKWTDWDIRDYLIEFEEAYAEIR